MNPCTEIAARTAIERAIERPLIILELPKDMKALEITRADEDDDEVQAG